MTDRTQGAGGGSTGAVGAKGPDELRQQIERTRSQLGDTVEELAAKADVKGRAKARAADLKDKAGALTVQLRSTAAQAGHRVQEKTALAGHRVQEKTAEAGHRVQEKTAEAGHRAQLTAQRAGHTTGDSVRRPVSGAVEVCRRHPRQLMIVGAVGAAALVAGLLARRRGSGCH
ncbi:MULTISPECIES: DUF3618 domain-containing protein [Streptomyces]|uniref:DUF3618 domain-containing protein n=1 Tax=Streptomyces TaxID=1883 RepID=UPI000369CBB0|nr:MULTISPECIES: DUF3618 domain-containing protein [Streptomyces]MYX45919.1 DUF3618 domain-containing protein [Streptomyces sp. SID89]NED78197.1 DUF3618 domain-containing protein [Streptomyces sp. SID9944]MBY8866029.1 DUF3618 domain-containing protein [Streptomyces sennicomposti]MYX31275.1 DUF3618 domain-containing protein [Streptomyces sp. SID8381]NED37244.1 DUF3618 domain-containing protein [Streptomyces sp. SID8499]